MSQRRLEGSQQALPTGASYQTSSLGWTGPEVKSRFAPGCPGNQELSYGPGPVRDDGLWRLRPGEAFSSEDWKLLEGSGRKQRQAQAPVKGERIANGIEHH